MKRIAIASALTLTMALSSMADDWPGFLGPNRDGHSPDKGLLKRHLCKVSGRSRAQMTRLIAQFLDTGVIEGRCGTPAKPFSRRYTR